MKNPAKDPASVAAVAEGWRDRALDRSSSVRRTRERVLEQTGRLIDAARQLYDESSGLDFTVQQLADGAGMSLQTFYRYFKSKDDLMLVVYERTVQDAVALLRVKFGDLHDPVERLHEYTIRGLQHTLKTHPGGYIWTVNSERVRLSRVFPDAVAVAFRPYEDLLAGCIQDGIATGVMSTGLPSQHAASVVATLVTGLYRNIGDAVREDPDVLLSDAWTFMRAGLGVEL